MLAHGLLAGVWIVCGVVVFLLTYFSSCGLLLDVTSLLGFLLSGPGLAFNMAFSKKVTHCFCCAGLRSWMLGGSPCGGVPPGIAPLRDAWGSSEADASLGVGLAHLFLGWLMKESPTEVFETLWMVSLRNCV